MVYLASQLWLLLVVAFILGTATGWIAASRAKR